MGSANNHIYEFDSFCLNPTQHILERNGEIVPLTPKAFETLLVLVENSGKVVDKVELLERVWADTFVEETNLTKNISILRKILGNSFIETIPKRGYRFVASVEKIESLGSNGEFQKLGKISRVRIILAVVFCLLAVFGMWWFWWKTPEANMDSRVKSLAVLPLKSLDADENYLGLGIADAVIRRISQTGELNVRPTSAVRRYLNEDTDALAAARQLNADAVLEGSIQRNGDRLRVSVNLLRAADGVSLWSDNFDMQVADIFTIQDTVAQEVASRLRLQLDPAQQARLTKRYTSNSVAYEYYVKGVNGFDQRNNFNQRGGYEKFKPQMEATIALFKKAIEADPNYALAHAQLAYAYAWTATLIEPTNPVWAERAKEEIELAQALDPQVAETHLARHLLLWSAEEGWQIAAAVHELLTAQQLNPNIGHTELGDTSYHLGIEEVATREFQRAHEIDPTSESIKNEIVSFYQRVHRHDEYLTAKQKYLPDQPISSAYFMGKGRLDEAQKEIERLTAEDPDNPALPITKALYFALKEDFRVAQAELSIILRKDNRKNLANHHTAYEIACVYALMGKSDEAVKWLRETAVTGFPCYSMFERDHYLNRIRQEPEFIKFMTEMKELNEKYRSEFK